MKNLQNAKGIIHTIVKTILKVSMMGLVVGHWFGLHNLDSNYLWATIVLWLWYAATED